MIRSLCSPVGSDYHQMFSNFMRFSSQWVNSCRQSFSRWTPTSGKNCLDGVISIITSLLLFLNIYCFVAYFPDSFSLLSRFHIALRIDLYGKQAFSLMCLLAIIFPWQVQLYCNQIFGHLGINTEYGCKFISTMLWESNFQSKSTLSSQSCPLSSKDVCRYINCIFILSQKLYMYLSLFHVWIAFPFSLHLRGISCRSLSC